MSVRTYEFREPCKRLLDVLLRRVPRDTQHLVEASCLGGCCTSVSMSATREWARVHTVVYMGKQPTQPTLGLRVTPRCKTPAADRRNIRF